MDNATIERIYRSSSDISHVAGLRAVFDIGYYLGAKVAITATSPDVSSQAPNQAPPYIQVKTP